MTDERNPLVLRRSLLVILSLSLIAGPLLADPVRQAMGGVFGAMRVLLPLSGQGEQLASLAEKANVEAAIALLDKSAQQTAAHMGARSADDAAEVSRALERDVHLIRSRFDAGDAEGAAFLIRQLSQRCVACHLRLPKKVDSPVSGAFVDGSQLKLLPPHARAPLQVAVRQFDDALTTWEQAYAAERLSRGSLQSVDDYLKTAIRGRRDLKRPNVALRELAARPDLPNGQRLAMRAHVDRLEHHRHAFNRPPSLAEARRLMAPALDADAPLQALPLVDALIASAKLQALLDGKALHDDALAEARFLLGLAQARAGGEERSLLAPVSFEAAVRTPRGGPHRQRAYDALVQLLHQEHQGTSGGALPSVVSARLGELRAVLGAPAPDPGPAHGRMP